jgi:aspartyl-tRNA(Asn)/glutamyl-tRNA(Gln) amidotransferase subunit A
MPATQYIDALRLRARFNRGFARLWERFDALVSPPEPDLSTLISVMEAMTGSHEGWDFRHTVIANLTGMPAVVVPCYFNPQNLPFGLQIMAAPFADATALGIAEAFQSVTDWHARVPPGFE